MDKSKEALIAVELSKYVIGLDFGTTFSGFACAARSQHNAAPDKPIYFEDSAWEGQTQATGLAYCKTITSLLYQGAELQEWGWPSVLKYNEAIEQAEIASLEKGVHDGQVGDLDVGNLHLVERFKLHLAPKGSDQSGVGSLPKGVSVEKAISDYLKRIGEQAMAFTKKNFGDFIQPEHVQWCLTGKASFAAYSPRIHLLRKLTDSLNFPVESRLPLSSVSC
jgi:hypothetical protein